MLKQLKYLQFAGFTLVELLVALVVSSLLLIGMIAAFVANANHYQKVIDQNRLNQQLEAILDIMANDIRRAGYDSTASNDIGLDQNTNPFQAAGADISVNGANDCILFTYDHGNTGSLPSIAAGSDDDRYGYLLSGNVIYSRPPGAAFTCSSTGWEAVTDSHFIQITALSFTLNTNTVTTGPGTRGLSMRSVDISITGQLTSNSNVTNTLTQHVRLQNDKFIP